MTSVSTPTGATIVQLSMWRFWLTFFSSAVVVLTLWSLRRIRDDRRLIWAGIQLALLPLCWTSAGHWAFQTAYWLVHFGVWTQLPLLILMGFAVGANGVGNIWFLVLAGFLYPDVDLLRWVVLPALISAIVVNFGLVKRARISETAFVDANGQPR